jgi:hypothetical protein
MARLYTFDAPIEIYSGLGLYNAYGGLLDPSQFTTNGHKDFDGNGSNRCLNLDGLAIPLESSGSFQMKCYLKPNAIVGLNIGFGSVGANLNCGIVITPNLRIDVNGLFGFVHTRAYRQMILGTWNQFILESNFKRALDGGYLKIWLNGELIVDIVGDFHNETGDMGGPTDGADIINFTSNGGPTWYIDDLELVSTGTPNLDDYYGVLLRPDGDYASTMASRTGGATDTDVLGESNVDTATYVTANTALQYVLTDNDGLPWTPLDIATVQAIGYSARTGAITTAAVRIDSGGTTDDGPSTIIPSGGSYKTVIGAFDTDPDTGIAWTEAGVNALRFGVVVGV